MTDTPSTEKLRVLDGVTFTPMDHGRERATRDGFVIGEHFFDKPSGIHFAQRITDEDYRPVRSAAEARSYIVSKRDPWFPVASELLKKLQPKD